MDADLDEQAEIRIRQGHHREEGVDLKSVFFPADYTRPPVHRSWPHSHFTNNIKLTQAFWSVLGRENLSAEQRAPARDVFAQDFPGYIRIGGASGIGKTTALIALAKAWQGCGMKVLMTGETAESVSRTAAMYFTRDTQMDGQNTTGVDAAASERDARAMSACQFQSLWHRTDIVAAQADPNLGIVGNVLVDRHPESRAKLLSQAVEADRPPIDSLPYIFEEKKLNFIQHLAARMHSEAREYLAIRDSIHNDPSRLGNYMPHFYDLDLDFSAAYVDQTLDVVFATCAGCSDPHLIESFRLDVILQDDAEDCTNDDPGSRLQGVCQAHHGMERFISNSSLPSLARFAGFLLWCPVFGSRIGYGAALTQDQNWNLVILR